MNARYLALLVLPALAFQTGCSRKPAHAYYKEHESRFDRELRLAGGSYLAWEHRLAPFTTDVYRLLASRPKQIAGLEGRDGYLFFRKSVEALVFGDARAQDDRRDPFPAVIDFARQLRSRGVDFLFCPIPVKGAVCARGITERAPGFDSVPVNLYTRKLMRELTSAGVECIDLLPHFLEAQAGGIPADRLYMKADTHWTPEGLELAASVFADRVRQYEWYGSSGMPHVEYSVKTVTARRRGDIVSMLPESERRRHRPMTMEAKQVLHPDGTPYRDDESSPVLFLGDSYSGVFHFEDCRHAGVTAHLAHELSMPIDLILGQGMGPNVRGKLIRRGDGALADKRLVIWALSERDLYAYREAWKLLPLR